MPLCPRAWLPSRKSACPDAGDVGFRECPSPPRSADWRPRQERNIQKFGQAGAAGLVPRRQPASGHDPEPLDRSKRRSATREWILTGRRARRGISALDTLAGQMVVHTERVPATRASKGDRHDAASVPPTSVAAESPQELRGCDPKKTSRRPTCDAPRVTAPPTPQTDYALRVRVNASQAAITAGWCGIVWDRKAGRLFAAIISSQAAQASSTEIARIEALSAPRAAGWNRSVARAVG